MNYILFDSADYENLKPLTFTRPIAEIRCGIVSISEKWNMRLRTTCSWKTQHYLQAKFPLVIAEDNIFINATVLPTNELVEAIQKLQSSEGLFYNGECIAMRCSYEEFNTVKTPISIEFSGEVKQIRYPWHIFTYNGEQINADFELLTAGRTSQKLSTTNTVMGEENIFVEEGAEVECAILNATKGKLYIGKEALIMEGAIIRAPFALCEHAVVKMAAKIYADTTVGPYCKVGGELQNAVLFGYSNKGHDGYLGNAVIGEWCNLGADTNNSNLKNDYSEVKVWNYATQRFMKTGLQFCGLIMGDHSKSAINTAFNTGTVVGVSSNVYGAGFPRNFIPSFSRGGSEGMQEYALKLACDTAARVFARRDKKFNEIEHALFEYIFNETQQYRRF
ncbi:MAG: GlmU family protein [Bacteroidales bacterium]|jgi:UDP-N-acetylglucosamine diphosphorylase/glucosamine-1-phosphate N-acetyltransferase|nr:GlmU family protein [Bacteroidales bacterium]